MYGESFFVGKGSVGCHGAGLAKRDAEDVVARRGEGRAIGCTWVLHTFSDASRGEVRALRAG